MKSTLQVPAVLLGTIVFLVGAGCGTGTRPVGGVSTALVMTTHADTTAWEYGRHDEQLNVGRAPVVVGGWAEIRTWEQQRTSNGRPREQSTTYTRTYTRRPSD